VKSLKLVIDANILISGDNDVLDAPSVVGLRVISAPQALAALGL
jgi:hypothetical protein